MPLKIVEAGSLDDKQSSKTAKKIVLDFLAKYFKYFFDLSISSFDIWLLNIIFIKTTITYNYFRKPFRNNWNISYAG